MWDEGDVLYVAAGGGLTNVVPVSGVKIPIAVVVSSSVHGTLFVRANVIDENAYALRDQTYTKAEVDSTIEMIKNNSVAMAIALG